MINFASDNASQVCPDIIDALARVNEGPALGYGNDAVTRRLEARFNELFEREVAVFPVATGTAANALGLSVVTPPYGVIYCPASAHIEEDECGAPEFYCGGARLATIDTEHGKLDPADLAARMSLAGKGVVHHMQPAAVSISQTSEFGTVYTHDEIAALSAVSRRHGVPLHMDGARFANAIESLGCAPADVTWKAGVDVLSFGATKNGAMGAEAVIFFNPERAADFIYRRKRGGHLLSKMRYLSAQLEAYLQDDLWLRNAAHANGCARQLEKALSAIGGVSVLHPVEANELFVSLSPSAITGLEKAGVLFYRWGPPEDSAIRLVCSWNTTVADMDALVGTVAKFSAGG